MGPSSQFFRAGVGIVVVNEAGQLLVFRRADCREPTWQFPQGGLDAGESAEEAMWRELEEETGLGPNCCQLLATSERWHAYELPPEFRSGKMGRGQVQKWFACRLTSGSEARIRADGQEFIDWKWTTASALLEEVVPFRRQLYTTVLAEFADLIV